MIQVYIIYIIIYAIRDDLLTVFTPFFFINDVVIKNLIFENFKSYWVILFKFVRFFCTTRLM